jgi:hypothetical protein
LTDLVGGAAACTKLFTVSVPIEPGATTPPFTTRPPTCRCPQPSAIHRDGAWPGLPFTTRVPAFTSAPPVKLLAPLSVSAPPPRLVAAGAGDAAASVVLLPSPAVSVPLPAMAPPGRERAHRLVAAAEAEDAAIDGERTTAASEAPAPSCSIPASTSVPPV